MSELRTRLLVGLLVLFAAATEASPQTEQSGPPASQVAVRQNRKSAKSRSSLTTGTIPGALPRLCFQPGVGWQRILPEPPGVPVTPGANGSTELAVSSSGSVAQARSIDARSSGERPEPAADCAGISANKKASRAGVGEFTILNRSGTIRSAGSTESGTVTSRGMNSPPPIPTYFASKAESDLSADRADVREFHAYVSSIKLRRLIQNAPEFRTRSQLQQLQNNPAAQLHKARVGTNRGAARRSLSRERASRTSSRRSDTHDQPRDNPGTMVSGAYR